MDPILLAFPHRLRVPLSQVAMDALPGGTAQDDERNESRKLQSLAWLEGGRHVACDHDLKVHEVRSEKLPLQGGRDILRGGAGANRCPDGPDTRPIFEQDEDVQPQEEKARWQRPKPVGSDCPDRLGNAKKLRRVSKMANASLGASIRPQKALSEPPLKKGGLLPRHSRPCRVLR
eukprot:scaffold4061_cov222-Pinguiococcus_pyrenoidosus.AAC.6